MKKTINDIYKNVLTSIISAILIATLFFIWNDFFHRLPDLSGAWQVEHQILESNHTEYEKMTLFFDVLLQQTGDKIFGTGEKIAEKLNDGKKYKFERDKRVHIEITGTLKNNFLIKDNLSLHYVEHGHRRDSSTILNLEIINDNILSGTFFSTAADSSGKTNWGKTLSNK